MKSYSPLEGQKAEGAAVESGGDGAPTLRPKTKAETYAASLYALAKAENIADQVDQDLQFVSDTVISHLKLKEALKKSDLPLERKQAVVEEVFSQKISPLTLSYVRLLVGVDMTGSLDDLAVVFRELLQADERMVLVEVTTAVEMDKPSLAKMTASLSRLTGKDVKVRLRVDKSLIGGALIRLDGRLLDASVKKQLELVKEKLSTKKE